MKEITVLLLDQMFSSTAIGPAEVFRHAGSLWGTLVGGIILVKIGFSLFPKAGVPQFMVKVDAAEGASLAETDRAARFVETVLARHREVSKVAVTVGKGHPQIYYNVTPRNERASTADDVAPSTS